MQPPHEKGLTLLQANVVHGWQVADLKIDGENLDRSTVIIMEDGGVNLEQLLKDGKFTEMPAHARMVVVLKLALGLSRGLFYYNTATGYSHKDVKPTNGVASCAAWGEEPGDPPKKFDLRLLKVDDVKLLDFGFARRDDQAPCWSTDWGTEPYIAPEMYSHTPEHPSRKVDIWSFGVLLLWLLDLSSIDEHIFTSCWASGTQLEAVELEAMEVV